MPTYNDCACKIPACKSAMLLVIILHSSLTALRFFRFNKPNENSRSILRIPISLQENTILPESSLIV